MQLNLADIPNSIGSVEALTAWGLQALESRVGVDVGYDAQIINTSITPVFPVYTNTGKLQTGDNAGRTIYRYGGWFWLEQGAVAGSIPVHSVITEFNSSDLVPTVLLGQNSPSPSPSGSGVSYEFTGVTIPSYLDFHYQAEAVTISDECLITEIPNQGGTGRNLVDETGSLVSVGVPGGYPGICALNGTPSIDFAQTSGGDYLTILLVGCFDSGSGLTVLQDSTAGHELRIENGIPILDLYFAGTLHDTVTLPAYSPGLHVYLIRWSSTGGQIWIDGVPGTLANPVGHDPVQFDTFFAYSSGKRTAITDLAFWSIDAPTADLERIGSAVAAARNIPWTTIP